MCAKLVSSCVIPAGIVCLSNISCVIGVMFCIGMLVYLLGILNKHSGIQINIYDF
jgi:hypothetical protein